MKRIGYGQVEPNHLSGSHTGQIYAQLPATGINQLENGQFLKYDYANKRAGVGTSGDGKEWFLVFNEEKLYDERYQNHRYAVELSKNYTDGTIYPRLIRTYVGDIFTTNTFKGTTPATASDGDTEVTMEDLTIGDYLTVGADGWLTKTAGTGTGGTGMPDADMVWQVVPHFTQIENPGTAYTLPDGQPAVKIQRVK